MIAAAVVTVLLGAALGVSGPRLAGVLPGRAATILLTVATLACALATGLVLCAIACLALAESDVVADIGDWSQDAVAGANPVPAPVAIACGVVAATLMVSATIRVIRSGRALLQSARSCRQLPVTGGGLVVVDDDAPEAYALPGWPGRFVVTRGMLRALSPAQRRALLAHESAHTRLHHYAYVQLVKLAASACPLLRPAVGAVQVAVERWADDVAVAEVGDAQLVATTLARAGLARQHARSSARPAGALAASSTALSQRLSALLTPRPTGRSRAAAVALAAIVAVSVLGGSFVAARSHGIVEYAELVPAPDR